MEQIGKSFMKNWGGNLYNIEDCIDKLTHSYKLTNTQSPLYLYSLIPAERELSYNLRMPHPYDPQSERTMRFSNTYFQNCKCEWNSARCF